MDAYLVRPSETHKDSFIAAVREFQLEGRYFEVEVTQLEHDFAGYIGELLAREVQPRPKRVKETILWLVDEQGFIGRASIRHELNERLQKIGGHIGYEIRPSRRLQGHGKRILALALVEARKLWLTRVLLTCDSTNAGSRKIIEANGGRFAGEIVLPVHDVPVRHYWIDIP